MEVVDLDKLFRDRLNQWLHGKDLQKMSPIERYLEYIRHKSYKLLIKPYILLDIPREVGDKLMIPLAERGYVLGIYIKEWNPIRHSIFRDGDLNMSLPVEWEPVYAYYLTLDHKIIPPNVVHP